MTRYLILAFLMTSVLTGTPAFSVGFQKTLNTYVGDDLSAIFRERIKIIGVAAAQGIKTAQKNRDLAASRMNPSLLQQAKKYIRNNYKGC